MKQGFDGMLLDATSDYDAMTPPSSPLQARTRRGLAASGQGSSQNLLEVPGTSTHSEASKKGLGFREEEEENTAEGEEIKDDDEERGKEEHPRFFVMKSFTQFDIDISKEKSIWATQPHNERKLNDAFDVRENKWTNN